MLLEEYEKAKGSDTEFLMVDSDPSMLSEL